MVDGKNEDWLAAHALGLVVRFLRAATQNHGRVTHGLVCSSNAKCAIVGLSFLNMGLGGLMGALGILTLLDFKPSEVDDFTTAFLSVYMVIFGVLLFLYELIWWQPIASLNRTFRKNFGFMYGLKGKGFYLVFIAFLTLGLRDNSESGIKGLDWATGVGWLAMGCVHVFVAFTWQEAVEAYKPPSAGLANMGDDANVV